MSIADEIRKLQELHGAGALTDAEFAQAKARVLGEQPREQPDEPQPAALRDQLTQVQRQEALDRLDQAWLREREQYMVTSRYGNRYIPAKGNTLVTAVGIVGFGAVWVVMAATFGAGIHGAAGLLALVGVVSALAGLAVTGATFMQANQYDQAYQRYREKRAQLLAGSGASDQPAAPTPEPPAIAIQHVSEPPIHAAVDGTGLARPPATAIQNLTEHAPCSGCGQSAAAGQARCPHCGQSTALAGNGQAPT